MSNTSKATTPNLEQFLTKFRRFMKARFGVEIQFSPVDAQADHNRKLVMDLMMSAPIQSEEGLTFPVYQSYQLKGMVTVPLVEAQQRPEIVDLIELFLDGPMALRDRLESLTHIESALQKTQSHQLLDNVIPIRSRDRSSLALTQPCLIESREISEAQKLAKEAHEVSGRFALVPLSDLTWSTAQDLLDLGPITLLIADIEKLSLHEQGQILSFLEMRRGAVDPQIIACTSRPYSELRASAELNMNFLYRQSSCFLRMDRPFEIYKRSGLLKHLLMTPIMRSSEPVWN